MALEVDYVNTRSRDEKSIQDNVNITFNPATGIPYPYSNAAHRAFPLYGVVGMIPHTGRSDYHGLQTSFTKRMSHRWQGSLTYTLAGLWDQDPPPLSGFTEVPFPVAQDLGGERSLAETDQRHRLVFNGIWQVGHGFQVSGLYFYGSGSAVADRLRLRCARTADHQRRSPARGRSAGSGRQDHPARQLRRPADSPRRPAAAAARAARRASESRGFPSRSSTCSTGRTTGPTT